MAKIIKDSFDNAVDINNTKGMTELGEIMHYVQGKYVSDINIITSNMKPIERLKMTVSDFDCIKAKDVVIPILDQVITAGLKVQIAEVWLTVIESKVVGMIRWITIWN